MKIHYLWLGLIILTGCGRKEDSTNKIQNQKATYSYPALDESSLPPPPPEDYWVTDANSSSRRIFSAKTNLSHVIIKDDVGLQGEIKKIELIEQLREYSSQVGTNNPFALTEEEIEEISNLNNPKFN